jgi:hypothetical protein
MSQAVNTAELDEYLEQVVQALRRTVNYAVPHVKEPTIADKAVRDCGEILAVVMEGNVAEWLR